MLAAPSVSAAETSVSVSVMDLKFIDAGIGLLELASGYGALGKGAHGTFVKIPPGFGGPLHAHSDDSGVVISGVLPNASSAKDRPLPPGSCWFQKWKANHVTKCLSANECVFFITQPGRFDFIEIH